MFVSDLFEKKKQDTPTSRFVGGASQDARVKNALDNAYRAVPAAKSPEEAALGYIDIQNSLNQQQDRALAQQTKTNQQQTKQISDLVADMRRKEKDFRDLNAQVANMPNVTPQQVAKMAQDIEAAHDTEQGQPVDVSNVIAKRSAEQPTATAKQVAAPGPGASISQLANFQQAKDQGATPVATKPTAKPAPAKPATPAVSPGAQAFGAMAGQLSNLSSNLPSQTYAAKTTTPGDSLKKNVAAQTSTPPDTTAQAGDEIKLLDPDQLAAIDQDQETPTTKTVTTEAFQEGDPNQGSLNWTALKKAWMARLPKVVWEFGKNKSYILYQPQMFALLQVVGNQTAVEQEDIIQNIFSVRQRVEDLINDPVTQRYVVHFQHWLEGQMTRQQDQAQQSLLQPGGQPAEKGIDPETQQGELFKEDNWHAGDNSWSSEHDQWAKESTDTNIPKDVIQRYLAIDAEDDVAAVKAAIHAISQDPELKPTAKARLLGQVGMIIKRHRLPIGREYYQFMQQFMEATDYQKRRQRERDVDAGKPVAKQRQPRQTDYQKRRAQDKKDLELGESTNYWHRLQQERRRKAYSYLTELETVLEDIK